MLRPSTLTVLSSILLMIYSVQLCSLVNASCILLPIHYQRSTNLLVACESEQGEHGMKVCKSPQPRALLFQAREQSAQRRVLCAM